MPRIGSTKCPAPGCGNADATVSKTPAGTLHVNCHRCGFSGYGKAGTRANRLLDAATVPDAEDDATPAPGPALAQPPAKKPSGLILG